MHQNKMVATIKANGRILREVKDAVYIPFGSEFSVLLKNLNSVRASVNISIDGVDVTEGISLIVNPNTEFDLQRYIKNGNVEQGNKFKFIERSGAIEKVRNNKIDDGLIRVSFKFEKPALSYTGGLWFNNGYRAGDCIGTPITYTDSAPNFTTYCSSTEPMLMNCASGNVNVSKTVLRSASPKSEVGITVPGAVSDQKFETVATFNLEAEEHVIVLKMLGETEEGAPILQPVTVKSKPKCVTCLKVNKATAKFCSDCGTSLQIV